MASYPSRTRRRANGEGSIYYVAPSERWRGALTWTDAAGKRHRRVVSGKSQADVRRRLAALRVELDRGLLSTSRATVAGFLAGWLERERQRLRPSTWRQREQYTRNYIVPAMGAVPLAKLTPTDVERMTTSLVRDGKAPRTAVHARVILRRALGDALRDGLVSRNVAALARPPRVTVRAMERGRDYLDTPQLRTLLVAVSDDPLGPLVTLAATTGLRQGELLGLAWGDADLDAGSLSIRRSMARSWDGWALAEPKTPRSRRTISLPSAAVAALRRRRDAQEADRAAAGSAWQDRDGLVFTDRIGRPLRGYNVNAAFHGLLERAGLPPVPFHALRHSAATALLAGGVPLRVVSDLLGHSTIAITADTYAAVVPELRREAADAMDRVLGGDPS